MNPARLGSQPTSVAAFRIAAEAIPVSGRALPPVRLCPVLGRPCTLLGATEAAAIAFKASPHL